MGRINLTSKFNYVELFAGIGGFHLGLAKIGGQNLFASEWDRFAVTTYKSWFPEVDVETKDIREVDHRKVIPRHDLLVAGFPCQPFSLAGVSKKNSLKKPHGFLDPHQGNLFFSIAEIVRVKRPKIILLENVKNLKSHDGGKTWNTIADILQSLNYDVKSSIIDAKHWVPQHRERVYIVAFDRRTYTKQEIASFHFPSKPKRAMPKLQEILETDGYHDYELSANLWKYLKSYAKKHAAAGNGFGYQVADKEGISRTLSARYHKDGSEILIIESDLRRPRRLMEVEAARLMGFDSKYRALTRYGRGFQQVVSKTQSYKQFGNAVVPHVVTAIANNFKHML